MQWAELLFLFISLSYFTLFCIDGSRFSSSNREKIWNRFVEVTEHKTWNQQKKKNGKIKHKIVSLCICISWRKNLSNNILSWRTNKKLNWRNIEYWNEKEIERESRSITNVILYYVFFLLSQIKDKYKVGNHF